MRMPSLFIAAPSNRLDVSGACVLELLLAYALAEHRVPALDVLRAVRGVDAGAHLELPLGCRGVDPVQLLHLRVGDLEDDVVAAVAARGDLLGRVGGGRRAQDLDVADDDPGEVGSASAGGAPRLEGCDEVDPVADLEDSGHQLVLVAVDLDRALDARQLSLDSPLRRR